MKRYKLIREYPGSPKLGTILTLDIKKRVYAYDKNNINVFRHKNEIENHPEFWEEVVKKDYEILTYKNFITGAVNTIGQRFLSNEGYREFTERDLDVVNEPTGRKVYFINSVKRLLDGEVFTVGDNTSLGILKSIELTLNAKISGIKLNFKNNHKVSDLCFKEFLVQKVKQPIFETKEVVKKEFEILSFKTNSGKLSLLQSNGNYFVEDSYVKFNPDGYYRGHTVEEELKHDSKIHSVKRMSDGEIFTIGDYILHSHLNSEGKSFVTLRYKIEKIYFIQKGRISFYVGDGLNLDVDNIQPVKKPLLTTDFEGDEVTWVFSDNSRIAGTRKADTTMYRNLKYFSTKEKAEEYDLMNESKYSLNDILASLPNRKCEKYTSIKQMIENLKNM